MIRLKPQGTFTGALAGLVAAEVLLISVASPLALLLPLALALAVFIVNVHDSALVLACIGLVTISWDRASFRAGGMTLKPAYVAFTFALVMILLERGGRSPARSDAGDRSRLRIVRGAVGVSLVLLLAATARSGHLLEGGRQMFVIVVGALVPAWVCFQLGHAPKRRAVMMSWALIGAGVAAAFGIYQFAAGYLGAPTFFAYTGVGGNLGRTAGLSYEPAFFSMYLLSVMPLLVVVLLERGQSRTGEIRCAPRALFLLLLIGVFVSNARAGYLVLPFAIALPLLSRGPARPVRARPVTLLASAAVALVIVSVAVNFDLPGFVRARFASITDTKEAASNAPRLLLYDTGRRIAVDHPVLGIGPGTLGYRLPEYGFPLDYPGFSVDPSRAVANNIWLQAALDAGVGGIVGMGVVIGGIYLVARRCRDPHGRQLAVGCLLVFLVGGALTSIFWDAKYWALIGLALAADTATRRDAEALATASSWSGR